MRMLKWAAVGAALALAMRAEAIPAIDLILIHRADLPQVPAVLQAWTDAAAQEPYASAWTPEWRHPVPREVVARTLSSSLTTLRRAATDDDRKELLLAIGLTARFAHNVDVERAAEAGIEALTRAASRPGSDPRPEWFLGTNLCHMGNAEAVRHFEAAMARSDPKALPAEYWRDLLMCAAMVGMPAHVVLAAVELEARGLYPRATGAGRSTSA